MSEITLTIRCDNPGAIPEISDLFQAMTVEDKRALAAKLAFEFFAKSMNLPTSVGWNAELYGAHYLRDLAAQVRGHIGDELGRDPLLKAQVDAIVARCAENKEAFIQHAVTTALGKLIADTFQQMGRTDSMACELFGQVAMLKSAMGVTAG